MNWDDSESTNMWERFGILNAYYLPGGGEQHLYESITPVNTFRVILNHYFDHNLELLPDRSYYSLWQRPFWFVPVPPEEPDTAVMVPGPEDGAE